MYSLHSLAFTFTECQTAAKEARTGISPPCRVLCRPFEAIETPIMLSMQLCHLNNPAAEVMYVPYLDAHHHKWCRRRSHTGGPERRVTAFSKIRTNAPCVPQRLAHTLRIGKVPKVSQLQQLLLFATHSFAAFVCATAA